VCACVSADRAVCITCFLLRLHLCKYHVSYTEMDSDIVKEREGQKRASREQSCFYVHLKIIVNVMEKEKTAPSGTLYMESVLRRQRPLLSPPFFPFRTVPHAKNTHARCIAHALRFLASCASFFFLACCHSRFLSSWCAPARQFVRGINTRKQDNTDQHIRAKNRKKSEGKKGKR
jgi:hypothetical protein